MKNIFLALVVFGLIGCGSPMTLDEKIDKAHQ